MPAKACGLQISALDRIPERIAEDRDRKNPALQAARGGRRAVTRDRTFQAHRHKIRTPRSRNRRNVICAAKNLNSLSDARRGLLRTQGERRTGPVVQVFDIAFREQSAPEVRSSSKDHEYIGAAT